MHDRSVGMSAVVFHVVSCCVGCWGIAYLLVRAGKHANKQFE